MAGFIHEPENPDRFILKNKTNTNIIPMSPIYFVI